MKHGLDMFIVGMLTSNAFQAEGGGALAAVRVGVELKKDSTGMVGSWHLHASSPAFG